MASDHDQHASKWGATKKKPVVISGFEFVLMGADGALDKAGISQIRAHTTRELHRTRRQNGQVLLPRRRRNGAGNILFGSQFDPFHSLPQLPIEERVPGILDEIKHNGNLGPFQLYPYDSFFIVYNQRGMQQSVWPEGAKNSTFFTAMLLMCSVHLDGLSSKSTSPTTTALKLEAMRRVRILIQQHSPLAIISCISAIACLATCALVRGELAGAEEYVTHRNAYAVLIREAVRLHMFEESRFCKDVLRIITMIAISRRCRIPIPGLATPAHPQTLLKEYEHVFEDRWHSRIQADPELYSPLYDGRIDPSEDPFPFLRRDHLRLLVQMMQSVVKIWTRRDPCSAQQQLTADTLISMSLCQRILAMPSSTIPDLPCSTDYVYEACRLTSVLLIRSVESNRHWRFVAKGTSILQDIRDALHKTDLDNLWDKDIGLLYYVVLVFHSATFGTPHYLFGHILQTRIHFAVTYSYDDWIGAIKPMLTLHELMPTKEAALPERSAGSGSVASYTETLADMQSSAESNQVILSSP
ncbi:uncharacterized protein A1O5_06944 [Cladophialophora psammophila CBS 110553]|uniref:Transcription factor domain-containing protein n=1 Tax=Cladophialophora psammophila CBS 110553 TaxID=1182543 RepID=W9WYZ4_9EURO|nr:uncharacterized protein A1O5_06944 [Cladophialophora psammophila CBS 110553]EXJ69871.1 hypothetical protein A1O5_06944 [Cladophialophora psammophila CBS 110553]